MALVPYLHLLLVSLLSMEDGLESLTPPGGSSLGWDFAAILIMNIFEKNNDIEQK